MGEHLFICQLDIMIRLPGSSAEKLPGVLLKPSGDGHADQASLSSNHVHSASLRHHRAPWCAPASPQTEAVEPVSVPPDASGSQGASPTVLAAKYRQQIRAMLVEFLELADKERG
eukprot:s1084_g4.t1